jgi:hypothetical protein
VSRAAAPTAVAVSGSGLYSGSDSGSGTRPPHPGIPALAGIHLRSLVREFPVAWILFGGIAVGLPLLAAFTNLEPVAPESAFGLTRLVSGLIAVQAVTVLVALWWPDAVWRNLPPGRRRVMDALPVDRRAHRLVRAAAGLVLPLAMAASVLLARAILDARLAASGETLAQVSGLALGSTGVGLLAIGAAYLFGSALALRGWRVIVLSLLLMVVYVFVPIGIFMGLGWDLAANRYIGTMVQGSFSPIRVFLLGLRAGGEDLLPVLTWLAGLGVLCTYWARRHDHV